MSNKINLLCCGTKPCAEFPDPEVLSRTLEDGQIAYIRDSTSDNIYILTNQFECWSMIGNCDITCLSAEKRAEKIYKVEFMEYTDIFKDTVSNNAKDLKDKRYFEIGHDPLLVRESELVEYMTTWGKGIRRVEFVGNMWI